MEPSVGPGWNPSNVSLVQWILGAAWAVLLVIGGWIIRIFSGLQKKVAALELKVTTIEADITAMEEKVDERHRQNTNELAAFREFLTEEMRELRRRLDRLLERRGD